MPIVSSPLKPARSLILAGGGVRLAYHAGVLIALEEAGLSFNHVDGTSGGIFGTAMLASGITPKETAVRWRNLNLDGFMSALPVKKYFRPDDLPALGSADGIRKKIFPALGIDVKKINTNTTFDATFNVCNFSTKSVECIAGKDVNEDYLIAGMSLPIFMPAVKINNDWYTDAVWIKDANMIEAVKRGAEEVWLVWCIGNSRQYLNGSFNQYVHMIEISANGGVYAEIEWLRDTNTNRVQKGLKPIDLHIIKPQYPLPLDPDFLFNKINADSLINMGYADAKQYLVNKMVFDSSEATFKSTAMETVPVSVHFRQQFNGKINIEGTSSVVTINLSFFIREVEDQYFFQLFSSILINQGDPISGYDNIIQVGGAGRLDTSFQFNFNSAIYSANIKMQMHSVVDMLIGMDNKTAAVNISKNGEHGIDNLFVQPAINRLKNSFFLNVNADAGWYQKLKLKRKLLLKLFG
ncbi:MAG TPA: patatin-like phospholipase family protein [Mucilaginibacter sp.]|jgi:predicted acylesterase/phospholipase RssA